MTERHQQSNEAPSEQLESNVPNSWWPVLQYVLLLIGSLFLFYIPIVIAFPELFKSSKQEFQNSLNNQFWFHLLNQAVLLVAALFTSWAIIINREVSAFKKFGLTVRIKELLVGFGLGAGTMFIFVLVSYCLGLVEFSTNRIGDIFFKGFLLFFLVAITEEVVIRGYLLFKLRTKVGDLGSLLLTSSVFGIMHFFNDHFTWIGFANIFLSGLLMGLVILRTASISSAIGIHWAWNFTQGSIFGFAVSGNISEGILSPTTQLPQLMGGDFGIEGSVLLIPITLIFILLVYKYLNPKNA